MNKTVKAPAPLHNPAVAHAENTSTPLAADVLASARQVLDIERRALQSLSDELGEDFVSAVTLLSACKGRIIVSGMGKSGHVGNKIAATLASTGTPAFAVHPGEASHGDLGMVTEQDVVILLSNSGETRELGDIIAYAKRFSIPIIGITSKVGSTLAHAATVTLVLPNVPEACPMGLAPTTSTTAMLALGDCLSVSLLEQRGFTKQDFHVFHPGGKLGAGLKRVSELMHVGAEIPTCPLATPMSDALIIMSERSFGIVGVLTDEGKLAGVVTDGDLRRHMSTDLLAQSAGTVMSPGPKTIAPEALISDALRQMNDFKINCLFVVDHSNKPVGIVRVHDCLAAGAA